MSEMSEERKLELWRFAACGSHSNRYGEEDSVWDSTCIKCAQGFGLLKRFDESMRLAPAQPSLQELLDALRKIQMFAIYGCGTKQKDTRGKQFSSIVDICSRFVSPVDEAPAQSSTDPCPYCGHWCAATCAGWKEAPAQPAQPSGTMSEERLQFIEQHCQSNFRDELLSEIRYHRKLRVQSTRRFEQWLTHDYGFKVGTERTSYTTADLRSAWDAALRSAPAQPCKVCAELHECYHHEPEVPAQPAQGVEAITEFAGKLHDASYRSKISFIAKVTPWLMEFVAAQTIKQSKPAQGDVPRNGVEPPKKVDGDGRATRKDSRGVESPDSSSGRPSPPAQGNVEAAREWYIEWIAEHRDASIYVMLAAYTDFKTAALRAELDTERLRNEKYRADMFKENERLQAQLAEAETARDSNARTALDFGGQLQETLAQLSQMREALGGMFSSSSNPRILTELSDKAWKVFEGTASSTEWLSRHDTQQLELSCRELIALMDKRPELSQCVEPWESVRKALSRKLAEAKQEFAENLIQEVRPYSQITINGEHLVFEDWLRARAAALTPAEPKPPEG